VHRYRVAFARKRMKSLVSGEDRRANRFTRTIRGSASYQMQ
jgi:hypothetical protein